MPRNTIGIVIAVIVVIVLIYLILRLIQGVVAGPRSLRTPGPYFTLAKYPVW